MANDKELIERMRLEVSPMGLRNETEQLISDAADRLEALSRPSKQEAAREVQERDQFGHTPLEKSIRTTSAHGVVTQSQIDAALYICGKWMAGPIDPNARSAIMRAALEAARIIADLKVQRDDCITAMNNWHNRCRKQNERAEKAEARVKALTKSIVAIKDRAEEDDTDSHAVLEEIAEACTDILSQQGGQTNEA